MSKPALGLRESLRELRWWHWLIVAICVAFLAGLVYFNFDAFKNDDSKGLQAVSYDGQVGVPGQVLLPSLEKQPSPGWRIDLKELLPDVNRPSITHVGDVGDHAYFSIGYTARTGQPKSWLLAIDAAGGKPLFAPVEIDRPVEVTCLLNGPQRVLCFNERGALGATDATVIAADTGNVVFHGETNYQTGGPAGVGVHQVGDYVAAFQPGTGWRGIGEQGQLTWTVEAIEPTVTVLERRPGDPAVNLAVTPVADRQFVVFSAVDGKVLRKSGGTLAPVIGGFVEQERQSGSRSPEEFAFFDTGGERVARYDNQTGGPDLSTGTALPVLQLRLSNQILVLDNRGVPMSVIASESAWTVRFIGESVYTRSAFADIDDATAVWDKFDLRTGNHVSACRGLPVSDTAFVGSDGTVVVGRTGEGAPLVAVDTNTCAVLWQIDKPLPTWMVGKTLVQANRDGYEITSLVPPGQ